MKCETAHDTTLRKEILLLRPYQDKHGSGGSSAAWVRDNAACCIIFEIHIDLGIVIFQNTIIVHYTLVFHTL